MTTASIYLIATIAAPEGSKAATIAVADDEKAEDEHFDQRFVDNFDGIDWARLPHFQKPARTLKQRKSWIFRYGYRLALRVDPTRTFFLCKYCHQHRLYDATGVGLSEITQATTSASHHLAITKTGHRIVRTGVWQLKLREAGQTTIAMAASKGIAVSQAVANELGNFDIQRFQLAGFTWLVENNHPLSEFEKPAFRAMLGFANPEAEAALWRSHNSVSRFVLRLYDFMQPQVVKELSTAISKIHISFGGWTTKGGKRGFIGVIAHYATACGDVKDITIDLPHLVSLHSSDYIASCIDQVLKKFKITLLILGYFVLDNVYTNNTAVAKLSTLYNFSTRRRRLRCNPHILNLVGQAIIFGNNRDSYDNAVEEYSDEEKFIQQWRRQGPLGVLLDIINYIRTPQQYTLFENLQAHTNAELSAHE